MVVRCGAAETAAGCEIGGREEVEHGLNRGPAQVTRVWRDAGSEIWMPRQERCWVLSTQRKTVTPVCTEEALKMEQRWRCGELSSDGIAAWRR
jgi:hypothetical protein